MTQPHTDMLRCERLDAQKGPAEVELEAPVALRQRLDRSEVTSAAV